MIEEARRLVTPTEEEEEHVRRTVGEVLSYLEELKIKYPALDIELGGSIARGTWLPGDRDVDIFIIFPRDYPRKIVEEEAVSEISALVSRKGIRWRLSYAEHPYVTLFYKDFEIDVVPCYRIEPHERPLTAADRSPLHTRYVMSKLSHEARNEVRLLKKLMKNVGVYGAEIKTEGFSGYVVELLVIYYGSFAKVIEAAATTWRPYNIVVDIEGYYSEADAKRTFRSPIVVIDPVDKRRNAAAAVSLESLCKLIAASKAFRANPSIEFFTGFRSRQIVTSVPTLIVVGKYPEGCHPDVVWGQLKRAGRILANLLREGDFEVWDWRVWTDEKEVFLIAVTLEAYELPEYELHRGPPVYSKEGSAFVKKYVFDSNSLGPFIRGSRWYVIRRRKYRNAVDYVKRICVSQLPGVIRNNVEDVVRIEEFRPSSREVGELLAEFTEKRLPWLAGGLGPA